VRVVEATPGVREDEAPPDSELGLERSLCACLRPRPFVRPRNELPSLSQRKMKLLRRCRSQSGVPAIVRNRRIIAVGTNVRSIRLR